MTVRMDHPDLPDEFYDAHPLQVPHLARSGWRIVEGQDSSQVEQFPASAQLFGGQPVVRLRHPDLPGQDITVAESAAPFHRDKGWVPVEELEAEQAAQAADQLEDLTVAELQEQLRARELPVSGTKAELTERLGAALTEQPAPPATSSDEEE